jgi:alkanesulfonate monooxygenase SsuD/methylene tetrahydromethanopterin reductase-like flavin-dependent oxidoreductase (luciferase family)
MLEAYTSLGYLSALTRRVRLGTLVTWAAIRPPMLLIKAVATLAVLSGDRAWLGIGAGYNAGEAAMTGLPFPGTAERFDRLEEIIRLAGQAWRGDDRPFQGRHYQLERPLTSPLPPSRPRLLIGGAGERRTLPLVARYADACNLFDIPDGGATLRRKLDVLAAACEAVGRDRASIETTLSTRRAPGETLAQFLARATALRSAGIDHLIILTTGPWTRGDLDFAATASESLVDIT